MNGMGVERILHQKFIFTVGKTFDWKTQHWYFGEYINDSLGNGEGINCHPEFEIRTVHVFRHAHAMR
jgi:hypothetical protein